MMSIRDKFSRIRILLAILQWVFGFLSACIGAATKADTTKLTNRTLANAILNVQQSAWWILPLLLVLIGSISLIKTHFGPPVVWDLIHQVLNSIRSRVFT